MTNILRNIRKRGSFLWVHAVQREEDSLKRENEQLGSRNLQADVIKRNPSPKGFIKVLGGC